MEAIKELKTKYSCQQTKDAVNVSKKEYVEFVDRCLDNEDFIKAVNELLPFDNVAQAKLKIVDDASPVKSLGLSIMRMDPEAPLFSLGISIDLLGGEENKAVNSTIFISACRTLEELKELVKTDVFSMQVKEFFDIQIEESFSGQDKDL
jgi:hypothetical protein